MAKKKNDEKIDIKETFNEEGNTNFNTSTQNKDSILSDFNRDLMESYSYVTAYVHPMLRTIDDVLTPNYTEANSSFNPFLSGLTVESEQEKISNGEVNGLLDEDEEYTLPATKLSYLHKYFVRRKANLGNFKLDAKLIPVRADTSEKINKLHLVAGHLFNMAGGNDCINDINEDLLKYGWGTSYQTFNETLTVASGEGELAGLPELVNIDPYRFFPDTSAVNIQDARYIILPFRKTKEELLASEKYSDEVKKQIIDGTGYLSTNNEEFGEADHTHDYSTGQQNLLEYYVYFRKEITEDFQQVIKMYEVLGKGFVMHEEEYLLNEYPIHMYYMHKKKNDLFGYSDLSMIVEAQFMLNAVDNVIASVNQRVYAPQRVADLGRMNMPKEIIEEYANAPGIIFIVQTKANENVKNVMTYLDPPQLPNYVNQYRLELLNFIEDQGGVGQNYQGEVSGLSGTGAGGVEAAMTQANSIDEGFKNTMKRYLKPMYKHFLNILTSDIYEQGELINIPTGIVEQEQMQFKEVDMSELSEVNFELYDMVLLSTKYSSRQAQYREMKEIIMAAMQHGAIGEIGLDLTDLLRMSDFDEAQILIERIEKRKLETQEQHMMQGGSAVLQAQEQGLPVGPDNLGDIEGAAMEQMEETR